MFLFISACFYVMFQCMCDIQAPSSTMKLWWFGFGGFNYPPPTIWNRQFWPKWLAVASKTCHLKHFCAQFLLALAHSWVEFRECGFFPWSFFAVLLRLIRRCLTSNRIQHLQLILRNGFLLRTIGTASVTMLTSGKAPVTCTWWMSLVHLSPFSRRGLAESTAGLPTTSSWTHPWTWPQRTDGTASSTFVCECSLVLARFDIFWPSLVVLRQIYCMPMHTGTCYLDFNKISNWIERHGGHLPPWVHTFHWVPHPVQLG